MSETRIFITVSCYIFGVVLWQIWAIKSCSSLFYSHSNVTYLKKLLGNPNIRAPPQSAFIHSYFRLPNGDLWLTLKTTKLHVLKRHTSLLGHTHAIRHGWELRCATTDYYSWQERSMVRTTFQVAVCAKNLVEVIHGVDKLTFIVFVRLAIVSLVQC
jgi:hypothetical protein